MINMRESSFMSSKFELSLHYDPRISLVSAKTNKKLSREALELHVISLDYLLFYLSIKNVFIMQ